MKKNIIFFFISYLASIIGSVCGIGGGTIIKPLLDMFQVADVSTITFLSSCAVLSMSSYSVIKSILGKEKQLSIQIGTPLALGSAIGGICGKQLFTFLKIHFVTTNKVEMIQALSMATITIGTLWFTIQKEVVNTYHIKSKAVCILIGLGLGVMSSFLGIGGGPINLVVLNIFFSMDTKEAASTSLYLILFSQLSSLAMTLFSHSVPCFEWEALVLMVTGGIGGGILGRTLGKKITNKAIDHILVVFMFILIGICFYNFYNCVIEGNYIIK